MRATTVPVAGTVDAASGSSRQKSPGWGFHRVRPASLAGKHEKTRRRSAEPATVPLFRRSRVKSRMDRSTSRIPMFRGDSRRRLGRAGSESRGRRGGNVCGSKPRSHPAGPGDTPRVFQRGCPGASHFQGVSPQRRECSGISVHFPSLLLYGYNSLHGEIHGDHLVRTFLFSVDRAQHGNGCHRPVRC